MLTFLLSPWLYKKKENYVLTENKERKKVDEILKDK